MHVLHVISSIDARAGGPPTALLGLASAQKRLGIEVRVLTTFLEGAELSLADELKKQGIAVDLIGPAVLPLQRHPRILDALQSALAETEIIHIHALWEEIQHLAATIARERSVPYIFRPCGMLDPWSLSQGRLKKRLYMIWRLRRDLNGAAAIHYTTAAEGDLAGAMKLRPQAIIEPNGVDLEKFEQMPAPGTFREKYPSLQSGRMLLFMGRLHQKKGLDLLVPALGDLVRRIPDAHLVIAGPDESGYGNVIGEMAARHGVEGNIIMTGMLRGDELVAALGDADLFVLPSYQENFGNAVIESLAAGTPVVISDQVNIHKEILAGGVGGVVPMDRSALANELHRWLTNDKLREEARERAREFVRRNYGWDQIAGRWEVHYQDILNAAGAAKR